MRSISGPNKVRPAAKKFVERLFFPVTAYRRTRGHFHMQRSRIGIFGMFHPLYRQHQVRLIGCIFGIALLSFDPCFQVAQYFNVIGPGLERGSGVNAQLE